MKNEKKTLSKIQDSINKKSLVKNFFSWEKLASMRLFTRDLNKIIFQFFGPNEV